MNRKTLVALIVIAAVMFIGMGIAVHSLYSGVEDESAQLSVVDDDFRLFQAVPTDAVLVLHSDRLDNLPPLLADSSSAASCFISTSLRSFLKSVETAVVNKEISALKTSEAVLSFHYEGTLVPLLVIDVSKAGASLPEDFYKLRQLASDSGFSSQSLDCSKLAESRSALCSRNILVISPSDLLIKSSERHISRGISILDKDKFSLAASKSRLNGCTLFIPNSEIGKVLSPVFTGKFRKNEGFLKTVSDWCMLTLSRPSGTRFEMSGEIFSDDRVDRFLNVFRDGGASDSRVAEILPSYVTGFVSRPVADLEKYIDSYARYADSIKGRAKYESIIGELQKNAGTSPLLWAESLDIKELASAWFYVGDNLEKVILIRPDNPSPSMIFGQDSAVENLSSGYVPSVQKNPYPGFAASLFGSLFSSSDESCCTFISGWIVSGSQRAVSEYVSGRVLDTDLKSYMAGASLSGFPDFRSAELLAYLSVSDNPSVVDEIFRPETASRVREYAVSSRYCPSILKITPSKSGFGLTFVSELVDDVRTKAPEYERDVTVDVPAGPFRVKNCGTGKMNTFWQQDNMYLCLKDENGKGLWAVPFNAPICGRVCNVDFFTNGKLQFLFASGSEIHLIDRLGRFVKPFPVNLGKEILLGPDVYDFSGAKKYNILVLHKDNTVEMYNLQGKKPKDWKGITSEETITGLPEKLSYGGKTYWIVRTSIQTLIYPFYGGESLSSGSNVKIRPDSPVTPVASGIEMTGYDGRKHILKLNKN